MYDRRGVLRGTAALGLGSMYLGGVAWSQDRSPARMILPAATHDTLAIKLLLDVPPGAPPRLTIDEREVTARRLDQDGYAWGFVQAGLAAGTRHRLALTDEHRVPLREPWTLATLPALDATPEHFRVLVFTCAGGDDAAGPDGYLPLAVRRALLDRGLSFQPDLAIANGDHTYWDQWTGLKYVGSAEKHARTAELYHRIAWLDEDQKFDSAQNRRSLRTVIARQIAGLYEDRFASTPLLFISDDHDYYENDNAGPWGYAFPPRPFTLGLWQRTAAMAHPYALGMPALPRYHAETVETVRIGKLLEIATYDCRRGWSTGHGGVLFPDVERHLIDRLRRSTALHYIHAPSNPMGWSKGALGEWYADGPPGATPQGDDKGYWPVGWFEQHQRLVKALTSQRGRAAVSISGDFHMSGAKAVTRSGELDLSASPLHTIVPGTVSTGKTGFPSTARGAFPFTPKALEARDLARTEERNGFTILDVTPSAIEVRLFQWRPPEPVGAIASLQPAASFVIPRPA